MCPYMVQVVESQDKIWGNEVIFYDEFLGNYLKDEFKNGCSDYNKLLTVYSTLRLKLWIMFVFY